MVEMYDKTILSLPPPTDFFSVIDREGSKELGINTIHIDNMIIHK